MTIPSRLARPSTPTQPRLDSAHAGHPRRWPRFYSERELFGLACIWGGAAFVVAVGLALVWGGS